MADDSTTSLPSAEPPQTTPAEHLSMRLSLARASVDEYTVVHGGLPSGCPALPDGPDRAPEASLKELLQRRNSLETIVAWLRDHQHGLPADGAECNRALCLSGGGIRSATFGLGVLQGLAKAGMLDQFHYLSSVSGGGYIASWLTGWIRREGRPKVLRQLADSAVVGRHDLPPLPPAASPAGPPATPLQPGSVASRFGTPASPEPEPDAVKHLRAYSNYLSPAVGLSGDLMALVAIFVRNLFLHWTVLLPLLAAVLLLPRLLLAALPLTELPIAALRGLVAVAVASVVLAVAYMAADLPGVPPEEGREPRSLFKRCNLLPLGLASLLFAMLAPWLTTTASLEAVPAPHDLLFPAVPGEVMGVPWQAVVGWGEWGAVVHLVGGAVGWGWRRQRKLPLRPNDSPWVNAWLAGLAGMLGGGVLVLVLAALAAWWPAPTADTAAAALALSETERLARHEMFVLAGPLLTLGVFWLAVTLYAGMTRGLKTEEDREWWARAAGQWLLLSLGWAMLATLAFLLPRWVLEWPSTLGLPDSATTVGVGTGLMGVLTSAFGYWSKNGQKLTGQIRSMKDRLGAKVLDLFSALFLLLLAALIGLGLSAWLKALDSANDTSIRKTLAAEQLVGLQELAACLPAPKVALPADCEPQVQASALQQRAAEFRGTLHDGRWWHVLALTGGLGAVGALMAWWVGVNTFSLHSMYANRLTRAYLGATNKQRRPHWFTGFDPQDNPTLAWRESPVAPERLLPVINTALNLVQPSGDRLEWQQRKAASFTFTPLHCGSPVLGYVPTSQYSHGNGQGKGVSIGRAMAISGAAASPNMGYHSSTLVAAVMSLFNVRLGWWMPNTREASRAEWDNAEPTWGLNTLLVETLASTSADQDFVYLSDGGHFENLGLYEMVRRRCRRIVVVDATADANYRHDDLQAAVRKIRVDLGISVEFEQGLPTAESVRRTGQPWALGRVVYRDIDPPSAAADDKPVPDGSLVYLKPALWNGLPLDVERYAQSLPKRSSPFPHQTTGDQFFDEAQFESYRMLGMLTVLKALGTGDWPQAPGPDHRPPPAVPG